ncbi:MAG: transcriptional regulator, partial [Candidatus Eiseniibacteriota bacterium]
MLYHFGDFELDEGGRELRLAGREVVLQPRVFDLLVYLVRHRDRVITKDELLETLWPDVIVADGALQRAVSLARSALRSGGAVDAIRTYARHGYRFCAEVTGERPEEASPEHAQPDDRLANARRAFEAAAWAEAAGRYEEVDASEQLGGADLERWAQALHFSGRPQPALGPLERAVAAHLAAGDRRGAARAAVLIVFLQFENLELAVAKGWSRRAASLLEELPESREHGLLAYHRSRFGLAGGDLDEALRRAGEARDIGRRLDDSDVLALGLTAMGLAQLAAGNVQAGVALHDEAAATVLAGGVSPLHGGLVYCGVIFGCRNLQDWERAAQWSDQFTRWCADNGVSEVHGTCRLHRGEVLAIRGELEEAEREISDACRELAVIAPWVEGDGHRVLGEICMARGDLEGAERAFHRARELGWDPHPSYALFQLAQAKRAAALRGLERALADPGWANRQ